MRLGSRRLWPPERPRPWGRHVGGAQEAVRVCLSLAGALCLWSAILELLELDSCDFDGMHDMLEVRVRGHLPGDRERC